MADKTIPKEWSFDFDFSASMGETYTRFMDGLKEKKFLGNVCGGRTFFPPRSFCDRTFEPAGQWLESDGTGTVEAFTIYYEQANKVLYPGAESLPEAPYVVAVIKIGDSEQCFIHLLSGFDADDPEKWPEKIKVGMKVRPVWSEERAGNILDIKYFEPCD